MGFVLVVEGRRAPAVSLVCSVRFRVLIDVMFRFVVDVVFFVFCSLFALRFLWCVLGVVADGSGVVADGSGFPAG